MFKTETCDGDQLLFADYFTEVGFPVRRENRGNLECIVMIGPYHRLADKILAELVAVRNAQQGSAGPRR